jgi:Protein of unknown function (DUF993)
MSRIAYAAAHVAATDDHRIDWDTTLRFRHHLWSLGLGVADAMDTAQRGMGLEWADCAELIRRSGAEARAAGGLLCCGAGTDQLTGPADLAAITRAYEEQVAVVEEAGARVVLMCSRALAAAATGPEDYHAVYSRLLEQVSEPVILHWLGPMFDPALEGYWGSQAALLALIRQYAAKVDGIKLSLLDADHEVAFRRALPPGVRLYTGDDFHYPELIRGDAHGYSDALLGVFDPIAVPAAAALRALDRGDLAAYDALLAPTVPLARHLFAAPTWHYKTGIAFLAWLAGHQDRFRMVGGYETARSREHLEELYALAGPAGVLPDPELAARRLKEWAA